MKISKLIWSKRVADKIRAKHNVLPQEVKEICSGRKHVRKGPSDVYYLYGQTDGGRYLLVILANKGKGCFKVVTAREMDRKEKQFVKKRLGK